jgi:GntR family transcriptional regulator
MRVMSLAMAKAHTWNEDQPIYRQLMEEMLSRILDGTYPEGELLPSVRQLANDFHINPLTVAKAFQELSKEEVTEKRRGIGVLVKEGVRDALLHRERAKFLKEEWPILVGRIQRMGIDVRSLLRTLDR